MSGRAARVLIVKVARYAHYDGPSLSIGPSDNSLARMNVRNGSHALHLDPQNFEFSRFSGFQLHSRRDGLKSVLRVGGPIFGKATKVAKKNTRSNFIFASALDGSEKLRNEGIGV